MFCYYISKLQPKPLTPLRRAPAHSGSRGLGPRVGHFTEADMLLESGLRLSVQKLPILRGLISCEIVRKETFYLRNLRYVQLHSVFFCLIFEKMSKLGVSSVLSSLVSYLLSAKELLNIHQAFADLESIEIYYTYI